jgi:hypothetical protein
MADTLLQGATLIENTTRSQGDVPVGCILPWLKSFTGTPSLPDQGWMECDGSIVNDPLSPFNGQTLPDLNGNNYFLRGSDTSGSTGGESTHKLTITEMPKHSHEPLLSEYSFVIRRSGSYNYQTESGSGSYSSVEITTEVGGGGAHENKPPYYEVVWIIRIR